MTTKGRFYSAEELRRRGPDDELPLYLGLTLHGHTIAFGGRTGAGRTPGCPEAMRGGCATPPTGESVTRNRCRAAIPRVSRCAGAVSSGRTPCMPALPRAIRTRAPPGHALRRLAERRAGRSPPFIHRRRPARRAHRGGRCAAHGALSGEDLLEPLR